MSTVCGPSFHLSRLLRMEWCISDNTFSCWHFCGCYHECKQFDSISSECPWMISYKAIAGKSTDHIIMQSRLGISVTATANVNNLITFHLNAYGWLATRVGTCLPVCEMSLELLFITTNMMAIYHLYFQHQVGLFIQRCICDKGSTW